MSDSAKVRADVVEAWSAFCEGEYRDRRTVDVSPLEQLRDEQEFSARALMWWNDIAAEYPADEGFLYFVNYYRVREQSFGRAVSILEEDECPTN